MACQHAPDPRPATIQADETPEDQVPAEPVVAQAEPADEWHPHNDAEYDQFYAFLLAYLQTKDPHKRYHAYYAFEEQSYQTESDTLISPKRTRALLAAAPWIEVVVLSDIERCDATLARAAGHAAKNFAGNGGWKLLEENQRFQRFRDTSLPEVARLSLLVSWLNAVMKLHGDDRTSAGTVYLPVLAELEASDPSTLVHEAVPRYRDLLASDHPHIHWPGNLARPVNAKGFVDYAATPLGKIYEPDIASPLPEPHASGIHHGTCPQ
ncbi:hypothetical protein HY477_02440 [Candidatus Uhrbacteria bacterium]|nr:hypothetical protein [Candidatus Uhrbacteria bacterium]